MEETAPVSRKRMQYALNSMLQTLLMAALAAKSARIVGRTYLPSISHMATNITVAKENMIMQTRISLHFIFLNKNSPVNVPAKLTIGSMLESPAATVEDIINFSAI